MIEGLGIDVTRIVATHDVESDTSGSCCHNERKVLLHVEVLKN